MSRYDNRRGLELAAPLSGKMAYGSSATYDWDRNRIQVNLYRWNADPSGWDFEEECKQVLASLRKQALIDASTGRPQSPLQESSFASEFLPEGYSTKALSDTTGSEIDAIIELNVRFTTADYRSSFECTAPLLGTSYSVVKH
ncbi:hypothetical protein [Mesorhizobium sp.]|uniref:hypothetical protein n=1 Tax=Mesorhizobium sp. TaxID=1871066 RepID=UPI000FE70362|nr:hypothetical protein [Mesorhizobium sp.]RWD65293.1 MAG: hypothetical protein EOS37_26255 [Mesorhizobium sp.]